jgi:hypothetical protein
MGRLDVEHESTAGFHACGVEGFECVRVTGAFRGVGPTMASLGDIAVARPLQRGFDITRCIPSPAETCPF